MLSTQKPDATAEPGITGELDPYGEPADMPTHAHIIIPPAIIVVLTIVVVLVLSCVTQKYWWQNRFKKSFPKSKRRHKEASFLTYTDKEILKEMKHHQNRPSALLKIASPAILSIMILPVGIYLYIPLIKLFWPPKDFTKQPNANDAIQAFLTPAGLIYAIAFGFAFQEASRVQSSINERLSNVISCCFNIAQSVFAMESVFCKEDRGLILYIIKEETIIWIRQIMAYSTTVVDHNSRLNDIMQIVIDVQHKIKKPMDKTIVKKILQDLFQLEQLSLHFLGKMCGSMGFLHWAFLEILAYLAFFGVLMLNGKSYIFQLTICVITLVSISMFCYILSDLDNPYHGFYRMDISLLASLVERLDDAAKMEGYIPTENKSLTNIADHGRFSMDTILVKLDSKTRL